MDTWNAQPARCWTGREFQSRPAPRLGLRLSLRLDFAATLAREG